jgi:hypothetical protein
MTPKEKAEELVLKFREVPQENTMMWYVGYEISKEFALIAVNEILSIELIKESVDDYYLRFWQQVKQELDKL